MNSRLLPASISIFPRREPRWPEPELSTERYWGIKKGKYHYWTARGPAREAFEKIKGQIKDHLNSAGIPVPSSSFIQFDVFMIGKSQATARPYIMFSCKHLEPRKAAVAAIKESKLLDQCPPGVRIGDWDYPPYLKDLRKLASSPIDTNTVVGSVWNNEAATGLYNCSVYPVVDLKSGKTRALRLTTQNGSANDQRPCTATIGTIINIREKRFYLVPAHIFDSQGEAAAEMMSSAELLPEDSECDFGDSDSDDESSSGPQEESDFMSRYSESPKPKNLEEDWDLGDTNTISDGDSVQDFDTRSQQPPIIRMPRGGASRTIDGMEMSSLPHLAFSTAMSPRVSSGSLDYCLVEIVDEVQFSMDLPVLSRDIIGELNYKSCNVTAVTGSGNTLRGILSDHTTCVRLPNTTKFIDVLSVQFEGSLQPGDCGSVVQDVITGKIYGHIVAGDTKSQSALIVPAADVLNDVMAKLFEPGTVSAGHGPLPPPASEAPFNGSEDQFRAGIHFGPSSHPSICVEDSSFLNTSLGGPHLSNEDQDDHEPSSKETWHVEPFNSSFRTVGGEAHIPIVPSASPTVSCASLRSMTSHKTLDSPEAYAIAWITAQPIEMVAAEAMLDEEHTAPTGFTRHQTDANIYTWGRVGEHNIVIASPAPGDYGTTSVATTASSLLDSVPSIRVGLLVGIGGCIAGPEKGHDIRLGDIVVSQPCGTTGGVCEYDFIKANSDDKCERKGFLRRPPAVLLNALTRIQSNHERKCSKVPYFLQEMIEKNPSYAHQGFDNDRLFKPSCDHVLGPDCRGCDTADEIQRDRRDTTNPDIHYGTIVSGKTPVQYAITHDQIAANLGDDCLCFEMEAAGLMNHFPCLVIRGICDYADSHKNHQWQRYASATAAAYTKELLAYMPTAEVQETKRALEGLQSVQKQVDGVQQTTASAKSAVPRTPQAGSHAPQASERHLFQPVLERLSCPPGNVIFNIDETMLTNGSERIRIPDPQSIVDVVKFHGLDSSREGRSRYAAEHGIRGEPSPACNEAIRQDVQRRYRQAH